MINHKKRPKLKKYVDLGLFSKLKSKKKSLKFYSPDLIYLSSKSAFLIKKHFQNSLFNRQRAKLIFGFYQTALLNKFLRHQSIRNKNTHRFIKENKFCSVLERRLDVILCRLGFVSSLFEAKHLISHKKVKVNNLVNACFSRLLKKGDIISFEPSIEPRIKKQIQRQSIIRPFFLTTFNNLEVNYKTLKIILLINKINLKKQVQHYSNLLNWKTLITE
jgi:ribosomal protein S4